MRLSTTSLCGDWQGQTKCPEKETEYYEKYAAEYPDGPRTAQALYQAVYRQAVLVDMFNADNSDKKADAAKAHAHELAARMKDKFPQSDFTARAAGSHLQAGPGNPGVRDRAAMSDMTMPQDAAPRALSSK